MPHASITVSDRGVTLTESQADSYDVYCDDQHVWSFTPPARAATGRAFVPWPEPMRRYLDGVARFRIEGGGEVVYDAETRFGAGSERIVFRDGAGIPIMIDKWGLIQRPFTGRGREVVEEMVERTEQIIRVLAEECDVHCWIAFGTLLGAARSGGVIGHDSDIDLAYLSDQPTPAAMAAELYEMTRALRRHGMRVLPKSGSFITVLFGAPDGGSASIDVYTCFYLGDLLHESATVRAPVPRSAIEPLSLLSFEGRLLPAPADPEAMLVASYGPGWRTPDPSFRHQPGPEITRRFDGWFGSLMRNRREWERVLRAQLERDGLAASDFAAEWLPSKLSPETHVVDVGAGTGADALHLARAGWSSTALDYARGSMRAAATEAGQESLQARFEPMNLYDLRDALTHAALVRRRRPGPKAVTARQVLGALAPDGVEVFWRFTSSVLSGGGAAYVEIEAEPDAAEAPGAPRVRRFPVTPQDVVDGATAAGADRVTLVRTPAAGRDGARGREVYRFEAMWHAGPGRRRRQGVLVDD